MKNLTEEEIKDLEKKLDLCWGTRHTFTSIKAFILSYLNDTENYISSGSSRFVFKLNDEKVLKLAKNAKGIAQNEVEADWYLKQEGVAADWYDVSSDNIWIESEFCTKIKKKDFEEKEKMTFERYCDYIRYWYCENNGRRSWALKPEGYDERYEDPEYENSLLYRVLGYMADFGVPAGDITRLVNYGINQKGNVVLVDTGFNESVNQQYYQKK